MRREESRARPRPGCAVSVGKVLLDILVVLVAAKLAAEISQRIGIPAVVGEILAGMLIGPSLLGFVGHNETLVVLGELGVILLLFGVGMEMNLRDLAAVGRTSLLVAVIGVVVPMASGFGVATMLGETSNTALFLGAALTATSVGITARVFSDLRALATVEARTVLGAAVADDVLGLLILTVVVRVVSQGSVSVLDIAGIFAVAIGFLVVAVSVGSKLAPPLFEFISSKARSAGTLIALAFVFMLAFAEVADAAKLAPIVGAFVAGLCLSGSPAADRIERELAPVGHIFIPVFFLQIGIEARADEFVRPAVLGIAAVLFVVAVIGKLAAAAGAFGAPGDKRLIGLAMMPRGEVGLIFAAIGLREGVLGRDLYAALLLVVLATTLITPPLLRSRLRQLSLSRKGTVAPSDPRPDGGWLRIEDHQVSLAALPPEHLVLHVALDASLAVAGGARPSAALLDWIGASHDSVLRWDDEATEQLFRVLLDGDARAWRFLETTGVLERALPELAAAVARRRADPFVLEPAHVLRFSLVERVRHVAESDTAGGSAHGALAHPEWLLLGALILDTAGEEGAPIDVARRLVQRLDLGAVAEEEVALLVGDSDLLRAAARRPDGLDEDSVFAVAAHLDRPERAGALYVLTVAKDDLGATERGRLDELLVRVLALLDQPDAAGLDARNLVARRRAEAVRRAGDDRQLIERIEHAPRSYLLTHHVEAIARHVELLKAASRDGRLRVSVLTLGVSEWRIEIAGRDRPGLLATIAGVIADQGFEILDATVSTWPDHTALDSFRIQYPGPRLLPEQLPETLRPPDPTIMEDAIEAAFDRPLDSPPNPLADVRFDDHASPWYTLCEIHSPDQRGLLHSIAVAITNAGAQVHSARLITTDGVARDRFELTDRNGHKLDTTTKATLVTATRDGVTPRRRRFARRR